MKPFFTNDGVTIYHGDCLDVLAGLPDECVHVVCSSPPFFGLRDYGVAGQIGAERLHDCLGWATGTRCGECYVCRLTNVFREARRVLRRDGTLWLNLGDSYAGHWGANYAHKQFAKDRTPDASTPPSRPSMNFATARVQPKDMLGVPWRMALSLQADGWIVRADIIWQKPNGLPESVRDRPTKSHEYVFLLSRSKRYFFDQDAIREPCVSGPSDMKKMREAKCRIGGKHKHLDDAHSKASCHTNVGQRRSVGSPAGRNRRSVWTIPTTPYSGAHFAAFPPALIRPCILAGASAEGCCPACGAPYRRVVERSRSATRPARQTKTAGRDGSEIGNRDPQRHVTTTRTVGWEPTCDCDAGDPVPCTVLDPFLGSGTTAAVAHELGCRCIGIELNEDYCRLAAGRFRQRTFLIGT